LAKMAFGIMTSATMTFSFITQIVYWLLLSVILPNVICWNVNVLNVVMSNVILLSAILLELHYAHA
jgi:hypothetical protein